MVAHTTLRQAEKRLREVVNRQEVQDGLIADKRRWQQLCSSMDVIGDTDCAIAAYLGSPQIQDRGQLYLLAYGLLQVLFVQQDAVKHAAEAVGLEYEFPLELVAVREVRNNAIGHPTKRGNKNPESFGIVQVSMAYEGFMLYSFHLDKPDAFQPIRFKELIEDQTKAVTDAIEQIVKHLLHP